VILTLFVALHKHLYEKLYSARGQAENHIKAWKTHLASDRTSCLRIPTHPIRCSDDI